MFTLFKSIWAVFDFGFRTHATSQIVQGHTTYAASVLRTLAVCASLMATSAIAASGSCIQSTVAANGLVPDGVYALRNACSGKVLDVQAASQNSLAPVQIWEWGGALNQQWQMRRQPDGAYTLTALHSGQVLEVAGGGMADGAAVVQYPSNGGASQHWALESQGNGQWLIKASRSGKSLAVSAGAKANGAAVGQYTNTGDCGQRWKIQTAAQMQQLEPISNGKTYYVSPTGNGGNDGLSENSPLQTLNSAMDRMDPGDTMLVMNGTYTETCDGCGTVLYVKKAGRPDAWISVKAYPGHKPKLQATSGTTAVIGIANAASYLLIEGLELAGISEQLTFNGAYDNYKKALDAKNGGKPNYRELLDSKFSISGIVSASFPDNGQPAMSPHHITIRNNVIHHQTGCGICLSASDYLVVEDNVIHDNAKYAPESHSGLSIYQPSNFDDRPSKYQIVIRRNRIFRNESLIPFIYPDGQRITDGNGIILDDFFADQTFAGPKRPPYTGRTLVENNIVYENGGTGILMNGVENVDVINNITYHNSRPESVVSSDFVYTTTDSEIGISAAGNVNVFNNIMVAEPGKLINAQIPYPVRPLGGVNYSHNLVFGSTLFENLGINNLAGFDPMFINAQQGDFRLQPTSPAIDRGYPALYSAEDADQNLRFFGIAPDIGAYENSASPVNSNGLAAGDYTLTARHSGLLLDVPGSTSAGDTVLWQYGPNGSSAQEWQLEPLGGATYRFISKASGLCIDVRGANPVNGAAVIQHPCNGDANQQWRIEATDSGFSKLIAVHSGKVLDVVGQSTASNTPVQQWEYGGGLNQQWKLTKTR
jgi:parallel beta-helix repeat protein